MPTYVYLRQDGTNIEIDQSIREDALTECPETGQPIERVPQSFGSQRLGQGFYRHNKGQQAEKAKKATKK